MHRVLSLEERGNHWTHALVVFAEDGLKNCKIELTHFECDFIEDVYVFSIIRVLGYIK